MDKNIDNRIKEVLSDVLDININEVNDDSSSENISSWDSLKHMNLIISMEEEFKIEFEEEEIPLLTSFIVIKEKVNLKLL